MSDLPSLEDGAADTSSSRSPRGVDLLRSTPHVGTYAGIGVVVVGVVLLAVAWGRTAGLTDVGRQVPYLIAAGLGGIGVVAVGLLTVAVSTGRADAAARRAQADELREALLDLRRAIEEQR
jgi:hypothetical protein